MKNKYLYIVITVLMAVAVLMKITIPERKTENEKEVNDAVKFKEEYEEYNGKDSGYGSEYQTLEISENNPIKYSTEEEIINIMKNGTGIIYLGFPNCPWCRSMLPTLFEVASDYNIETIYYLNMTNVRDILTADKDGNIVYSKDENNNELKGTDGYFEMLEILDKYLDDYTVLFEEDISLPTGEKRIYVPFLVFVKNGEIIGTHLSTVESQTDPFKELTDKQQEELYEIIEKLIVKVNSNSCDENC